MSVMSAIHDMLGLVIKINALSGKYKANFAIKGETVHISVREHDDGGRASKPRFSVILGFWCNNWKLEAEQVIQTLKEFKNENKS